MVIILLTWLGTRLLERSASTIYTPLPVMAWLYIISCKRGSIPQKSSCWETKIANKLFPLQGSRNTSEIVLWVSTGVFFSSSILQEDKPWDNTKRVICSWWLLSHISWYLLLLSQESYLFIWWGLLKLLHTRKVWTSGTTPLHKGFVLNALTWFSRNLNPTLWRLAPQGLWNIRALASLVWCVVSHRSLWSPHGKPTSNHRKATALFCSCLPANGIQMLPLTVEVEW